MSYNSEIYSTNTNAHNVPSYVDFKATLDPSSEHFDEKRYNEIMRPHLEGYGPTPLYPYIEDEANVQRLVRETLLARYDTARDSLKQRGIIVPQPLHEYMQSAFDMNFARQSQQAHANWSIGATQITGDYIKTYPDRLYRGLHGYSEPSELLTTQADLHIPAVELLNATTPYGEGLNEAQADMRMRAYQAITERGGRIATQDEAEDFRIRHLDSMQVDLVRAGKDDDTYHGENYLLASRRRLLGVVPMGTDSSPEDAYVMEKLWYVLDMSCESGFNQRVADKVRKVSAKDNPHWQKQILYAAKGTFYTNMVAALSRDDQRIIKPISFMVYSYNKRAQESYAHQAATTRTGELYALVDREDKIAQYVCQTLV
ncbi:hypothetical protein FJZ39_01430 [Candidatus Saccharibacteria bacterium]|nr:hypothetical protein [Candidatus Saccharibacteria bacterium]